MSYILDALKKAESERKMGGVPDLHAQPVSSLARSEEPAAVRRALLAGAAVVVVAAAVVLAWTKPWHGESAMPAAPGIARAAPEAAPPAVQPAPAAPKPTPAAQPEAPIAQTPIVTPPARTVAEPTPMPVASAKPASEPKPALKQPEAKPANASVPSAAAAAPAKAAVALTHAASAEARVPEFSELPETIRREIPAFAFGGYLYSSTPADRTVLVNNRLLHEGDQIAPGLTLERMMPKEAVLNYLGYRYRVAY